MPDAEQEKDGKDDLEIKRGGDASLPILQRDENRDGAERDAPGTSRKQQAPHDLGVEGGSEAFGGSVAVPVGRGGSNLMVRHSVGAFPIA